MPKKSKGGSRRHYDGEKGAHNLTALVSVFRKHATGPEDDMHLSHVSFRKLCMEMQLGSTSLSDRIFAAMDGDNTGALDVHEFFKGMHAMHDTGHAASPLQLQIAFNMFNVERSASGDTDNNISDMELRGFLGSFYTDACELTTGRVGRWIGQFEAMFGTRVAATRRRGTDHQLEWKDTPAAQQTGAEFSRRVRQASAEFSRRVLDFTECVRRERTKGGPDAAAAKAKKQKPKKGEVVKEEEPEPTDGMSMSQTGFEAWCGVNLPSGLQQDAALQLQVLPWLAQLGDSWLERMKLPAETRQLTAVQPTQIGFKVCRHSQECFSRALSGSLTV